MNNAKEPKIDETKIESKAVDLNPSEIGEDTSLPPNMNAAIETPIVFPVDISSDNLDMTKNDFLSEQ